jgi:hypothetical protein
VKTLLFGANNQPLVVDVGPQERINALLVEVFGLLVGFKSKDPRKNPLDRDNVLKVIVDILGVEVLEERYGFKLEVTRRPHAAGSNPS